LRLKVKEEVGRRLNALKEKSQECLEKKWSDKMIEIPLFYDKNKNSFIVI
jgi:hypothetical protein